MNKVFVYGILVGREGAKKAVLPLYEKFYRGHATIKKTEGATWVNGELIEVDDETLEDFDRIEGVAQGYYHRFQVSVGLVDSNEKVDDVWVYQQVEDKDE